MASRSPDPSPQRLISFRARTIMKTKQDTETFGNTQCMKPKPINFSRRSLGPRQHLDREQSGREVNRLLTLRGEMMRAAKRKGDINEVYRLQNLGLFEPVELRNQECSGVEERDALGRMTDCCNKDAGPQKNHAHYTDLLTEPSRKTTADVMKPLPSLPPKDLRMSDDLTHKSKHSLPSPTGASTHPADLFFYLAQEPPSPTLSSFNPWLDLASTSTSKARLRRRQSRHAQLRREYSREAGSVTTLACTSTQCDGPSNYTTPVDLENIHPAFRSEYMVTARQQIVPAKQRIVSISQAPLRSRG